MINNEYIIALSMGLCNILKKKMPEKYKELLPIISFVLAIGLNVANAILYKENIVESIKNIIAPAGIGLGIFTVGTYVSRVSNGDALIK
jgi:hypothetical protein